MEKTKTGLSKGFTLLEVLVVLAIIGLLVVILTTSFNSFNKNQSLQKDTENIVAVLKQARNQTLASKNSNSYGVHFASSTITLFVGNVYDQNSLTNEITYLNQNNLISGLSLYGASTSVVFQKLTGETGQYGTINITSGGTSDTKVVTIYKTGLVESQ